MMLLIPGSIIAGLLANSVLSYLATPADISVPLSILISILIFGLNSYYFFPLSNKKEKRKVRQQNTEGFSNTYGSHFLYICVYGILFSILVISSVSDQEVLRSYVPWGQVAPFDIINIANAVAFSFFLPGYGLVLLLDKNHRMTFPLKLLLAYLISILFVALPTYAGASFGYPLEDIELFIIALYAVIFILLFLQQSKISRADSRYLWFTFNRESLSRVYFIKDRYSEFVVFASLFSLVVFYTYYLNDNHIVVDQWFHHGRALLIGSEKYREIASAEYYKDPYTDSGSDITEIYPPIFSSLLAGFFNLSNSASVNAYVSIGLLNAMPILAFYYFFTSWVPQRMKRAALLATTLFVLSSGFGWVYAIDLAILFPPSSEEAPGISTIDIIANVTSLTYDVGLPTTFINVGHPDITTPLIIIALPAGFTLLGMIKEFIVKNGVGGKSSMIDRNANKSKELTTITSGWRLDLLISKRFARTATRTSLLIVLTSFLGILSHDEFYLFIIIACFAIVILLAIPSANQSLQRTRMSFRNTFLYGYSTFFSSFLLAILLVALVDAFISPVKYYSTREIVGFPLISLCFIFVLVAWVTYIAIYVTRRKRDSSFIHPKKPEASSNDDSTKLKVHRGAIEESFYYVISKLKWVSVSREIKNLFSVGNSSSSSNVPTGSGAASLRTYQTIRLALRVSIVSIIGFLYLFTFLVWSQLSFEDIQFQVDTESEWNVPWYLYPMKFGVSGLLGLAFLLSYLFRKFEMEVFIFALVAVIALLAGPYYDEHRFGKYVMAGMASLAALLIYEIISRPSSHLATIPLHLARLKYSKRSGSKFNVVASGTILGLVITCSSLSILTFAGFVELFTNVPDNNESTRRDFPTQSEMQLLNFLRARLFAQNLDDNYNVALPDKEVDNNRGFLTKIYGFTPIPRAKLLQTPLVLNATTIETFYSLLDYGGSKFIVLPKKDLTGDNSRMNNNYPTGNIIHFALENFRKVFENDGYVVLEVPTLSPPSPGGDIALIYPKNESQEKGESYYQHYYPLSMFALLGIGYNTYIEGDLSAFSKKYVILTYDPPFNDSNLSMSSSARSNFTGVEVDNSIYFDYVRNGGNLILIDSDNYGKYDTKETGQGVFSRLFSISPTGNYARFDSLSDTTSMQRLKGVSTQKGPNFPEDQEQKIKEIRNFINISGKVERILYGANNTKDDNTSAESYYTIENNSNNNRTDNVVVAPFTIEKKYGNGKITYVNSQGYFDTIFNNLSSFNNSNIDNYQSNNKSHYFSTLANVTNIIVPDLAKEDRQFSRGFLNSTAYSGEDSRAQKIRQILDNIQISSGYHTRINSSSVLLPIINNSNGHLVAKEVTFASSSSRSPLFSVTNLSDENIINYELKKTETADSSLQSNIKSDKNSNYEYSFKNAKIRNLKMYGSYEVIVESSDSDKLLLPAFPSFTDYVAINLPEGFDMTIKLSESKPSYAEFEIIESNDDNSTVVNGTFHRLRIYGNDDTMARSLRLSNINSNEIHFLNTSSDLASNGYTTLLMKSPQIQVKEDVAAPSGIQSNYTENSPADNVKTFLTFKNSPQTEPIEIVNKAGSKESVIFRIDYVDNYNQPYGEGKKNHHLTYVEGDIKTVEDSINSGVPEEGRSTTYQYSMDTPDVKLPGDISERAKKQGVDVQWQKTMTSASGLLLVTLIIITAILATKIAIKINSGTKPSYEDNRDKGKQ